MEKQVSASLVESCCNSTVTVNSCVSNMPPFRLRDGPRVSNHLRRGLKTRMGRGFLRTGSMSPPFRAVPRMKSGFGRNGFKDYETLLSTRVGRIIMYNLSNNPSKPLQ